MGVIQQTAHGKQLFTSQEAANGGSKICKAAGTIIDPSWGWAAFPRTRRRAAACKLYLARAFSRVGGAPREGGCRCNALPCKWGFSRARWNWNGRQNSSSAGGVDARGKTPNGPLEERRPRNDPSALISAPFGAPFAFLPVRQQAQSNVAVAARARAPSLVRRKKGAGSGAKGFVSSSTRLCILRHFPLERVFHAAYVKGKNCSFFV